MTKLNPETTVPQKHRAPLTLNTGSALDKSLQILLQTVATYQMLTKSPKGLSFTVNVATLHLWNRRIKAGIEFTLTDDPPVAPAPHPAAAISMAITGIGSIQWGDTAIGIVLQVLSDATAFTKGLKGTKIEQKITNLAAFARHFDVSVVVTLLDNPH